MNGQLMNQHAATRGTVLLAVVDAPFMSTTEKVETLFLAALTRMPTAEEQERFSSLVDRVGAKNESQALADLFWVLLNSTEFLFNH
jgi:hypothetical protein